MCMKCVSLFLLQSGRRNVDLDLAFSHKKRGEALLLSGLCLSVCLSGRCPPDPCHQPCVVSLSLDSPSIVRG